MTLTNIILITINIISFIMMGLDKLLAILNKRRIPEKTLLTLALIGGSIGTLIGMILFHHKTKKTKFLILVPSFILINFFILYFISK